MKKLKFLLIAKQLGPNHADLVKAIQERGHTVHTCALQDVTLQVSERGPQAFFGEFPLSSFDIIIPRVISSNLRLGRFILQLTNKKQFVLDAIISKRDTFGKISQARALLAAKLHHPLTLYIGKQTDFQKSLTAFRFPYIAKPVSGSQGRGVFLIKNKKEALKIFPTLTEDYLFQEYLPIQFDFRIFVVGGKVLGGIKRYRSASDFRTNFSVSGKAEPIKITSALRSTALKAAHAFGYDVAGVDIAIVGKKLYVLEVNRSPQWQGLRATLGIDPAASIIEYCICQHARLQKRA